MRRRSALTLVELMLSLAILAIAGLALASMLAMVGSATHNDREGRSTLLRTHAAQTRIRGYIEPALCVLQHDPVRRVMVVWLADTRAPNIVNPTEVRAFWYDAAAKTLTVERVEFPEAWPQVQRDAADVNTHASADFAAALVAYRAAGYTRQETIARSVGAVSWAFNVPALSSVQGATRVRATLRMERSDATSQDYVLAAGLSNYRTPAR